jgi:hypothetical protein
VKEDINEEEKELKINNDMMKSEKEEEDDIEYDK